MLTLQVYFPSSETSVLMMTRDESTVGSLLLKRTRRDHVPNAADRETERQRDKDVKEMRGERVKGTEEGCDTKN